MGKFPYHAAAAVLLWTCCSGCTMCQQCELDSYSAYGGRWQRTDRNHGRVGSLFAPAGAQVAYDTADGDLPDSVGADRPAPAPDRTPGPDGAEPDGAGPSEDLPEERAPGDSVLEAEQDDLEERERRLREMELEDIRFQQ